MLIELMQKIFSVKNVKKGNDKIYKVITIMGIKFSFEKNNNKQKKEKLEQQIKELKDNIEKIKNTIAPLHNRIMHLENMIHSVGDARNCRPATGNLRLLQTVRAKVLKLVILILEKNNIEYWLDFGTLLGALRHKGFIPWDDDIDIATTRESYKKAREVLEKELEGTNLCVDIGGYGRCYIVRILEKNSRFHYVDIFPYDFVGDGKTSAEELKNKWREVRKKYQEEFPVEKMRSGEIKNDDTMSRLFDMYREIGLIKDGICGEYLLKGIDAATLNKVPSIYPRDFVYPLKKIQFEDFEAYAPNNAEDYLQCCDDGAYGDIWALPDLSVYHVHGMAKNLEKKSFVLKLREKEKNIDSLLEKYQSEE